MADGSISGRLSGVVEKIKDITVKGGSVESVKIRFGGNTYEVWPPARGFEVEITNARVLEEERPNFDVSITGTRVDTPPEPANFDVSITDTRVIAQ